MVQAALMDNEFESLRPHFLDKLEINTTAKNEHVGEIERKIRHIKNRSRSMKASLPYKALPKCVIKALLSNVVLWMNALQSNLGISKEFSPREIVLRRQLNVSRRAPYRFGSYGEAFEDPTTTNTMQERTSSCINLGPTGNFQGTHKFLCLTTGRVIKRRKFTELPMPDSMIRRVEALAAADRQTRRQTLDFRNRNNMEFGWDEDDEPMVEDNAIEPAPAPFPDVPAEFPGVPLTRDMPVDAIAPSAEPSEEELTRRALANANIGPNFIPAAVAMDDRSARDQPRQQMPGGILGALQNIDANIVKHENGELDARREDEETDDEGEYVDARSERSSSDDARSERSSSDTEDDDYVPSEQEDIELEAEEPDASQADNVPERRTSTRTVRPPKRYEDFQMLQARGDFKRADEIEATLEAEMDTVGAADEPIGYETGKNVSLGASCCS